MCGIAGFSGTFDRALLERMGQALTHRGPDDSGTWLDKEHGIGLAHRRLSIIDLSERGKQPMLDATRSVAIAYNGEIYNFRELRKELVSDGFAFNSHTDTEVILNLYLRDGAKCLEQLNGIFAFALWDTRDNTLLLARDGLGVKPLYFSETSEGILFASELKALLQHPGLDRTIDLRAVHDHLLYLWCTSPRTMLRSVRKLRPGHAMLVRDGQRAKEWAFYDLPYDQEPLDWPEFDAIVQVRKQLNRAVERQLVSDVQVGAFLSGGVDSSSVVAMAQRKMGTKRVQCFTIGFPDPEAQIEGVEEDLPYARRVASHLGVDLHTIWVGPEMIQQIPRMLFHLDEPQADLAPINALFITRLAREHGIKVLLSGAGGDDIFTGYRRHYAQTLEPYWSWTPGAFRGAMRQMGESMHTTTELKRRISKALRYADLEGDARLQSYFQWIPPSDLESVLSGDARAELGECEMDLVVQALEELPSRIPPLNRMLYLEGKFFLADHNLNYVDKVSMANGVEVRVPFLDRDLVGLACRLPIHYKQRGRVGKWVLRKAMEPYLPKEVIHRKKTGFGAPLRLWLRRDLRPFVEEVLSDRALRDRGLFDPAGVARLRRRHDEQRIDAAYCIFSMMCIELWCRMFLDQPTPTVL
jgi:asparagine synthase (glutamine-hydrolysing)